MGLEIRKVPRRKNPGLVADGLVVAYFLSEKYAERAQEALFNLLEEVKTRAETTADPEIHAMFVQLQHQYELCNWDVAEEFESAIGKALSTEEKKIVVGRCATRAITLQEFEVQKDGTLRGPRFAGYFYRGHLERA